MNLKKFTKELVAEWKKLRQRRQGLSGIVENNESGLKGEKTALKNLKNKLISKNYEFELTPESKSPADIIGFKKYRGYWHFALYQVKTSIRQEMLTSNISEKNTLQDLAKLLKLVYRNSDQTNCNKKKQIYITLGYIGVHNNNGRYSVFKKTSYQNRYSMNKLILKEDKKTEIKNLAHK